MKVMTNMVMAMRGTPETIMNRALEALEGFSDILSAPPLLWTRRPFSKNKNTIPILSSYIGQIFPCRSSFVIFSLGHDVNYDDQNDKLFWQIA